MVMELEPSLEKWVEAQLIDPQQAERIRAFESAQAPVQARALAGDRGAGVWRNHAGGGRPAFCQCALG